MPNVAVSVVPFIIIIIIIIIIRTAFARGREFI